MYLTALLICFVEDILLGSKNVATICHLSVDKCTGEIIEKYTLIDDNIHNSYPLIIRGDTLDEVYIVPGKFAFYRT